MIQRHVIFATINQITITIAKSINAAIQEASRNHRTIFALAERPSTFPFLYSSRCRNSASNHRKYSNPNTNRRKTSCPRPNHTPRIHKSQSVNASRATRVFLYANASLLLSTASTCSHQCYPDCRHHNDLCLDRRNFGQQSDTQVQNIKIEHNRSLHNCKPDGTTAT